MDQAGWKQPGGKELRRVRQLWTRYLLKQPGCFRRVFSAAQPNLSNRARRSSYDVCGAGQTVWLHRGDSVSDLKREPAQDLHSGPTAFGLGMPKSLQNLERQIPVAVERIPNSDRPDLENKGRGLRPESLFNPKRLHFRKFYASEGTGRNQVCRSVISVW